MCFSNSGFIALTLTVLRTFNKGFLTAQVAPFLLDKFGTQTDTSCVVLSRLMRDSSLKGISPATCKAIHSLGQSQFIICALPYVIKATARIFEKRFKPGRLGDPTVDELKLIATLNWLICRCHGDAGTIGYIFYLT